MFCCLSHALAQYFQLLQKTYSLKKLLLFLLISSVATTEAQKIESIHVNLYTDSLKKGTFNYINIDGLLSNGNYLPLDSSHLIFQASAGNFKGNSLWVDSSFKDEKVNIKVMLRSNPALFKQFDLYIKKKPDNERLKTADEIMDEINNKGKTKQKRSNSN